MNYLRADMYTYLDRSCPLRTDLHPVDDIVEIVIGEHRFGGDTLRLVEHLRVKACPDPAMSQVLHPGDRIGWSQ